MSNLNVELLLQTDNEKDKLFTQYSELLRRLETIARARTQLPNYKNPLADPEDIEFHVLPSTDPLIPSWCRFLPDNGLET